MKKHHAVILLSVLSVFFLVAETTIINFPAIFIISVLIAFYFNSVRGYVAAYLLSFAIDSLRVSQFGMTALFVSAVIVAIMVYEKLSGSRDKVIALFFMSLALVVYAYVLEYSEILVFGFMGLVVLGAAGLYLLRLKRII